MEADANAASAKPTAATFSTRSAPEGPNDAGLTRPSAWRGRDHLLWFSSLYDAPNGEHHEAGSCVNDQGKEGAHASSRPLTRAATQEV
jgi:hypothetical protein